ncbi:hypothetical protein [Aeromonas phage AerS_266]|nr:hypothetical protein [Aeromonas phage AerS_266]
MDQFQFKNPKLEFIVETGKFRLLEDYVTPECTVPKGFVTNGASSGRVLQTFFPSYHKYFPAAIVHDYMYATGIVSKEEADKLFKYNIEVRLKMSAKYYVPMYYAVKLFGKSHYKQK